MKKNNILILVVVSILVIGGLGFIFRDKLFNGVNDSGVVVEDNGVVKIKNLIKISAGNFDVSKLTINAGETVTFVNEDNTPHKIIGNGWQSAYFEKTGSFAKSDFTIGDNIVYLENLPSSQVNIVVK